MNPRFRSWSSTCAAWRPAVRVTATMGMTLAMIGATSAALSAEPQSPKPPRETEISYYYDIFEHTLVRPITRVLDPALGIRKLSGRPRQAINVDENDQVRLPSTWWQPRLGHRPVSVEQMVEGPGPRTGPAAGRWQVTRAKTQGVTPGFFIRDANGDRFILKFDPPGNPEMATGAGVVANYLFWAAGYNVPNDVIVTFRRDSLDVATGAQVTDPLGRKVPLTDAYLNRILGKVARNSNGTFRALASRLIPGIPLGPFEYRGRRRDDPEDLIPHERRRELRGIWAMAAWTNHADSRGPNSLDVWVDDGGRRFVRHYLIDLNGCLGSGSISARSPQTGNEYFVDYGAMALSLVTLGLRRSGWESTVDPGLPSIGFIESTDFDPRGWRPDYPNPAFDERTARDIRWGARIVAGFTDDHIKAAVMQARYSDPRASLYLAKVLIERRDKFVRHWLRDDVAAAPDGRSDPEPTAPHRRTPRWWLPARSR